MSRPGSYRKSAFVVDFDALKWAPLTGRHEECRTTSKPKDEDVARILATEAGIEVDYGELTMAILATSAQHKEEQSCLERILKMRSSRVRISVGQYGMV
jgi:hypothetical protein